MGNMFFKKNLENFIMNQLLMKKDKSNWKYLQLLWNTYFLFVFSWLFGHPISLVNPIRSVISMWIPPKNSTKFLFPTSLNLSFHCIWDKSLQFRLVDWVVPIIASMKFQWRRQGKRFLWLFKERTWTLLKNQITKAQMDFSSPMNVS